MKHFLEYRRASYEIIMLAESKASVNLEHEVEAFVVHTLTRYFEDPHIPTDTIAIKMMNAVNESGELKKQHLLNIAEECMLIDGLELNSRRWPNSHYYFDMCKLALEYRAWADRPPELFYERVAYYLKDISKVLHNIKI